MSNANIPWQLHWWVDESVPAIVLALVDAQGNYQYQAQIKLSVVKTKDPKDPFGTGTG